MKQFSLASVLFISEGDEYEGDQIEALRKVKNSGFDETELIAEGSIWADGRVPDIELFKQTLKEIELFPRSIHAPYTTVNLESVDVEIRKKSIAKVQSAIRFISELGGKVIVVHPTGSVDPNAKPHDSFSFGETVKYIGESVYELSETAKECGIQIALENLPSKPEWGWIVRPLESMQQLRSFLQAFDDKHVGICMDVGHTRLSDLDVGEQVRIAGERLFALHIQDGDGPLDCHRPPGQGVIDFDSFGQALSDIKFNGAWTMEVLSRNTQSNPDEVGVQTAQVGNIWLDRGMSNI